MMLGFTGVVGLELMDTTIKSAGEFKLKLSLPLISVIPEISGDPPAFPDKSDFVPLEPFKLAARRARNAVPKKGARFLIVSADPGEGRTVAAANLAACLGRQDERVLLIDTQLRQPSSKHELRSLIPQSVGAIKGLGEFLSYEADKAEEVVWPTFLPGVECLPMVGAAAVPEFLGSNRMRELLENVSGRYSVVLMDVLPVSHYADAESLALWADAVIFVVRSRRCRVSRLRGILDRLAATKTPVVGAILNAVDPLYL
jgi:Mrp family chromosome partitioning ATPase